MYECSHCGKKYKTKRIYQEHYSFCNFYNVALNSDENSSITFNVPDTNVLMFYMQQMCKKIDKLEKENVYLKSHIAKRQDKNSIINWLNENEKGENIKHLIDSVDYTEYIMLVINHNLQLGVWQILKNVKIRQSIRCIGNKYQFFCIYENDKWLLCDKERIESLICSICNNISTCFMQWGMKTKLIEQDMDMYIEYNRRILGPPNLSSVYTNIIGRIREECSQSIVM